MKLNGWKRIGVVASAVWILGAGFYTLNTRMDSDAQTAADLTLSCEAAQNGRGGPECDQRATDYIASMMSYERLDAAMAAFIPVPLGWGFTYLVLFIVRWVRRGFAQPV